MTSPPSGPDDEIATLVEKIHASPAMAVVAVTGGGAQALTWLLAAPGASRTVLEAVVPYGAKSLEELVGEEIGRPASTDTAVKMAHACYCRGLRLREQAGTPIAGLGCTAALATDRPKRGDHRCSVAVWTDGGVATYDLGFVKGLRDRLAEDGLVSRLVLRALAEGFALETGLKLDLDDRERLDVRRESHDPIAQLLAGHVETVTVHPDGTMAADEPVTGAVLAGSFDPLHEGHRKLADVASQVLGAGVTFELSVENVDKPPLEEREVRKRLRQFAGKYPVVVTRSLSFYRKARLFPGATFVIGRDTATRLLDIRYLGDGIGSISELLADIRKAGCGFLVAGRESGGVFRILEGLTVPAGFEDMFSELTESQFRSDISSTELRAAGPAANRP